MIAQNVAHLLGVNNFDLNLETINHVEAEIGAVCFDAEKTTVDVDVDVVGVDDLESVVATSLFGRQRRRVRVR